MSEEKSKIDTERIKRITESAKYFDFEFMKPFQEIGRNHFLEKDFIVPFASDSPKPMVKSDNYRIENNLTEYELKKIEKSFIQISNYDPIVDRVLESLNRAELQTILKVLQAITGKTQSEIIYQNEGKNVGRIFHESHPGKYLLSYKGVVQGLCYTKTSHELRGESSIEFFFDPQQKEFS